MSKFTGIKQKQREQKANLPADFTSSLALNRLYEDKKQVAMEKILKHHRHLTCSPSLNGT